MFDRSSEFVRVIGRDNSSVVVVYIPEEEIQRTVPLVELDDFVSAQESVEASCLKIEQYIGELDQLHRSALVTVDLDDSERLGKKIEAIGVLTGSESSSVRRILKAMMEETVQVKGKVSETDLRLRESKQRALGKKFMGLMEQYERMQKHNKRKYQKQLERQYLLVKPEATAEELESLRESPEQMSQQIFALSGKLQAGQALRLMQERRVEIEKLEKGMNELHEMFLDVSFLVSQQGYTIDRVEEYVDMSREVTEQSAAVMTETVSKQRRAQQRRWLFSGVGLIILLVLVVIIVLALTNKI